jgi:hypothetical protein
MSRSMRRMPGSPTIFLEVRMAFFVDDFEAGLLVGALRWSVADHHASTTSGG